MTETAFRVVVTQDWADADPLEHVAHVMMQDLRDCEWQGVTVTPMGDALIKAAEAVFRDLDKGEFPTATVLDDLRAAIANARGDAK